MNSGIFGSRILKVLGGILMLAGTADPMEGSLLILLGSGMVMLGAFLGKSERRSIRYWAWVFSLMAVGVGALWFLSSLGGIGGKSGHSIWWGLLILPYPTG
jgi:hypothetical protein